MEARQIRAPLSRTATGRRRSQEPRSSRTLSPVDEEILRVLLYFDIFSFPLTAHEIARYAHFPGLTSERVRERCTSGPLQATVQCDAGLMSLSGRSVEIRTRRIVNEKRARTYLRIAGFMAAIIHCFPFVRAVFLSGELSKGVASPDSDIDFVVVTAERRLWIVRTLLILFKKILLLNSKRFFCINHLVSERHLGTESRNLAVAYELATLRPLSGTEMHRRYVGSNTWLAAVFPNLPSPAEDSLPRSAVSPRRHPASGVLDSLDRWLLSRWTYVWERRYRHLPIEQRRRQYRSTEYVSTAYGVDYFERVEKEYRVRLAAHGLADRFHFS